MKSVSYHYTILESEMDAMNDLLAIFDRDGVEVVSESQLYSLVRLEISFPSRSIFVSFDEAFVELMG